MNVGLDNSDKQTSHEHFAGLSPRASVGPDQKRNTFMNSKPASTESAVLQLLTPPNELAGAGLVPGEAATSPIRRKMGGSYSRYTGSSPLQRTLTIDTTDIVDSSGRKINTSGVTGSGSNGSGSAGI